HRHLERVVSRTRPAFLEFHMLAVWITEVVDPCALVITSGIDDEGVAFPLAARPSIPSRIRIIRDFLPGREDFAVRTRPFTRLDPFCGRLEPFKRPVVRPKISRIAERIANSLRIVTKRRHDCAGPA